MASRPRFAVERAISVYGGNLALRGVRVKIQNAVTISEFAIPPKVRECTFNCSEFLYDFTAERDIMRRAKERERARVAAVADAAGNDAPEGPMPRDASQIFESVRGGEVLQPIVCASNTTNLQPSTSVQAGTLTSFSEFENQTSTPFEDMELRTIDDMSELRTILQPADENTGSGAEVTETSAWSDRSSEIQPNAPPTSNVDTQRLQSVQGGSGSNKPIPKARPNHAAGQGQSPVPKPRNRPLQEQTPKPLAAKLPPGAQPTVLQAALQQQPLTEPEPPPYPGHPVTTTDSFPTFTSTMEMFPSPQDLPPPYRVGDMRPPPIPPRLHGQETNMRQSCPPPSVPVRNHQTQTGWKKEDLGLIDPFFTLTAAEKSVVEKIVSMGFLPRERVARAVKQLASEKEIVDFLVNVDKIVGMPFNYPADSVELALTYNKGNMDETLDHLKTVSELKEIGFPEKLIHEALHNTKNDTEKAIDYIMNHL